MFVVIHLRHQIALKFDISTFLHLLWLILWVTMWVIKADEYPYCIKKMNVKSSKRQLSRTVLQNQYFQMESEKTKLLASQKKVQNCKNYLLFYLSNSFLFEEWNNILILKRLLKFHFQNCHLEILILQNLLQKPH